MINSQNDLLMMNQRKKRNASPSGYKLGGMSPFKSSGMGRVQRQSMGMPMNQRLGVPYDINRRF
jgi:hypothetical protein